MTPPRWQEIKEITADALELPAEERSGYIERACGGDPALREEVERMVAAADTSGLLDRPIRRGPGDEPSLPEGTLLAGRFRIGRLLARGGMGEVYRALDERMQEEVALKIISREIADRPGMVDRFRHEVQRARRITHPNVCRIHDLYWHPRAEGSNLQFLTMQLVAGPTLGEWMRRRGRIGMEEALPVLEGILAGLQAAHEAGIAHCDLKPNNVLLEERAGQVQRAVITDFGLARVVREDERGGEATRTNIVGGAPAYLAPEMRWGSSAGVAGDIYAFGIIAYELLTGVHPFDRKPAWELGAEYRPRPPRDWAAEIPAGWEAAILRCLEAEPGARFGSAGDLREAVERGGGARKKRSVTRRSLVYAAVGAAAGAAALARYREGSGQANVIAVLPFSNASRDASLDYLGEGITESLINSLSQIPKLRVPAVGLVRRYKGNTAPLQAGHELKASAVLAGAVRRRDSLLSVEVELIDVASGRQLWGKQYNLAWTNVLDVQESICAGILSGLQIAQGAAETRTMRRGLTSDEAAFDTYLRGQYFLGLRTEEGLRKSLACFSEAVERDPKFALAYTGLASSRLLLGYFGMEPPANGMPAARSAAERALALEPTVAEAHTVLGAVKALFDWDWNGAEASFRRAIALQPTLAEAHHWYATFVLSPLARHSEAIGEMKRALNWEPSATILHTNLGLAYYEGRRFREAIAQLQRVVEMSPNFALAYWTLGQAWAMQGDLARAVGAHETALRLQNGPRASLSLAYCYAVCGRPNEARRLLNGVTENYRRPAYPAAELAFVEGALGEADAAFQSLADSWAQKEPQIIDVGTDPKFDSLRNYPEYPALLRRINLGRLLPGRREVPS